MKPEFLGYIDIDNFVYARCKCELPTSYAIKIKREAGKNIYHFKCDLCKTEGDVISHTYDRPIIYHPKFLKESTIPL